MVSEPLASEIALDPVDEALDDIGDFFEEAWDDTRDFIKDHPIISGALAIATGTWFISAAGGFAAAGAKLATGITNVIGSFTPTISSTSIGASINVGSFASASVGAGVNGLTAFAGANVSILGVPVWGVGSSLSALGSFGSTIGGSITNNLLGGPSLFGSGGSIDVGSFAKATVNSTLTVLANESGLTTVHDAFHATRETAQDIYRALAPPPPPVIMQPVSYGASGLTPVEGTPDLQSVGPTGGNPFAGLEDWPTFDVSNAYYESGSGDYNGTRFVSYSSSAPQREEYSWESVSQSFVNDWDPTTDYGNYLAENDYISITIDENFEKNIPRVGFVDSAFAHGNDWLSNGYDEDYLSKNNPIRLGSIFEAHNVGGYNLSGYLHIGYDDQGRGVHVGKFGTAFVYSDSGKEKIILPPPVEEFDSLTTLNDMLSFEKTLSKMGHDFSSALRGEGSWWGKPSNPVPIITNVLAGEPPILGGPLRATRNLSKIVSKTEPFADRLSRVLARTPEEIADRALRADALKIHRQFPVGRARNGKTVATAEIDGQRVYSISNNRTSRAARQRADELGYERIFGKRYTRPNQTDAEQILLNYADDVRAQGGRIAPSRPACGTDRQNCAGRIDDTPGFRLIGPRK